jgi:hypothetical protein
MSKRNLTWLLNWVRHSWIWKKKVCWNLMVWKLEEPCSNPKNEPSKNENVQNQNWRFSLKEKLHSIDRFWFSPQNLKLPHKEQSFYCKTQSLTIQGGGGLASHLNPWPLALTGGIFVLLFLLQEMEESLGGFFFMSLEQKFMCWNISFDRFDYVQSCLSIVVSF